MTRLHYQIKGMSCAACVSHVERAVKKLLSDKDSFTVSLLTNSVSIVLDRTLSKDEEEAFVERLAALVKSSGYRLVTDEKKELEKSNRLKGQLIRLITSAIFVLILMYLSMGHMVGLPIPRILTERPIYMALLQLLLTAVPVALNFKYFKKGFSALLHLAPNMDSLIAVGSGSALLYGTVVIVIFLIDPGRESLLRHLYFESAAMILTLVSFGKLLESGAKEKASDAVRSLAFLSPKYATVVENGVERSVSVKDLKIGDLLLIRAGELIAVDGTVVSGTGSTDESALTGESMPVEKEAGDAVRAACVLLSGAITVRADHVGEDTSLSRIIRLLEDAAASKAPIARIADRVSAVFVPVVMSISLITLLLWIVLTQNFEKALLSAVSVLVISCPCALGLATPTAITVGIGRGARMGILFRNAEALEKLCSVKTVVFDKTGTVTEGKPSLTDVYAYGIAPEGLLEYAGAVERLSAHPLAQAITSASEALLGGLPEVTNFRSVTGVGAEATLNGAVCRIGRPEPASWEHSASAGNEPSVLEKDEKKELPLPSVSAFMRKDDALARLDFERLESDGKTAVTVTLDGRLIGVLGISDRIRAEAKTAISALREDGVKCLMLTGDNEKTAAYVANEIGLDGYFASLMPEDKERMVKEITKDGCCAMVGDGINDAPALVRADVGIAVGAGTEIAVDCAGVVLSSSALTGVYEAYGLSRAAIRVIKQNLFWALFYNAVCIPVAAGVLYPGFGVQLNPMLASAAMSFSSVCVVLNALRLRKIKINPKGERKMIFSKKEKKTVTYEIGVEGMMCQRCVAHVKEAVSALKGVCEVNVSLEDQKVTVSAASTLGEKEIRAAIVKAGYAVK